MLGNAAGKSELGRVELAEAESFHKVTWEPERPEPAVGQVWRSTVTNRVFTVTKIFHSDDENRHLVEYDCIGAGWQRSDYSMFGHCEFIRHPERPKPAVGQVWNIPAFDGRAREHTIATIHDNPGGEEGPIIYWGEGGGANLVSDLTCETSSWEFVSHPELKSKILRDNLEVGENDYPPLVYPTKLIEPEPRRGFHWDDDTEALRQRLADGDTSIGWGTVTAERDMERYDTDPATGRMSYTPGTTLVSKIDEEDYTSVNLRAYDLVQLDSLRYEARLPHEDLISHLETCFIRIRNQTEAQTKVHITNRLAELEELKEAEQRLGREGVDQNLKDSWAPYSIGSAWKEGWNACGKKAWKEEWGK
jgi:hypothetical protein